MRLQQAPTFRPFPGEFVSFTSVAVRTCQYKISHVIGRNICAGNTGKREGVFYVIDISPLSILFNTREPGIQPERAGGYQARR